MLEKHFLLSRLKLNYILISIFSLILIFIFVCAAISKQDQTKLQKGVIDCSKGRKKCKLTLLEYNLVDCKKWYSECTKTKEGLEDITYITGDPNYISSPFTNESFTLQFFDVSLKRPWDLEFLPDGSMLITEQLGNVVRIKDGKRIVVYKRELSIFENTPMFMAGLLGLAIDLNFDSNNYVYLSYTFGFDNSDPSYANQIRPDKRRVLSRVSRFKLKNDKLINEFILIDNIPGSLRHVGLRLEFGPDEKLYLSTGDAEELILAQKLNFLGGKILRLNKDGSIPDDNPFPNSYVYSRGHRNTQGLAWNPVNSDLYNSEHGPFRYDEINHIVPGNNYGWGAFKCNDKYRTKIKPIDEVTPPVVCFKQWTIAPSGMEFVSDPKSPWYKSLFVTGLKGRHLHRYKFDNNDNIIIDEIFFIPEGKDYIHIIDGEEHIKNIGSISHRLRDVEYHNGSLYVLGAFWGLVKITPK